MGSASSATRICRADLVQTGGAHIASNGSGVATCDTFAGRRHTFATGAVARGLPEDVLSAAGRMWGIGSQQGASFIAAAGVLPLWSSLHTHVGVGLLKVSVILTLST
jgi:hypothetical protein